jgi:hypothetical protein
MRTTVNLDPATHAGLKALEKLFIQEKLNRHSRSKLEVSRAGLALLPKRKGIRVTPELVKELLESSEYGSSDRK